MLNSEDFPYQEMKLVDMSTFKNLWRNSTGCRMFLSSSHTLTQKMVISCLLITMIT
ncbi:hypothetical protein ONE63_004597 [Megalurothrips usitatus]|uniref:Uncharacterized protein n=1 Tax=Megalurothrips usitatus TaxID=439358 RepID=A0AAV7X077_9NEOP|nr:hypothetical protein ONE63_004597 [Megalurothrips usitatus]